MKKTNLIIVLILLAFGSPAIAQPDFPANNPVFDSSVVARVDITVNPDSLIWLYENVDSDIEFNATFRFFNGTIDETVENIGFRLRGNTSRYAQKKSFKVSFNTFEAGRKFYGMEKMNLNGEHNDPSIIRSRLCWTWLRELDVAGPRATHAAVYINGSYYGLYIIVEHVDEEFVESRFDNKNGNLFLCLWPADLAYLGSNPDLYKLSVGDRQVYELKTNEAANDYSDLAEFIGILNNTPLSELECRLEEVFNLNDYLKIMAFDIVTGNWDGYIYNKNNFYLYHNTKTGKFEYIPYDLDNTLGIDWLDRDWGNRDIYEWSQHGSETRPLYTRLMAVPEIRERYSFYFREILELLSDEDSLFAAIDEVKTMISPYVVDDPFYPLDYGYTYNDFLNSFNQALDGHVDYGLKPYLQTRISSAWQQIEISNIPPAINYIRSSKAVPGEEYWVRAFVEDENAAPLVRLVYQVNGAYPVYAAMYDDGEHHDHEAGDGFYGCILPPFQFNQTLSWQVTASDNLSQTTTLPCSPHVVAFQPSTDPQLFINELMADNDFTIADEYGEYDNWVEIYNGDSQPVWLGDKYLSDNLSNPDKWQMPDLTMPPGSFLIIWTDNDPDQGPLHTDYKLDDEGEELGIFDSETSGYFLIDSVIFGEQEIDISFGRQTDGNDPWIFFAEPTPGFSNGSYFIRENESGNEIMFYPNPASGKTINFFEPFTGNVVNALGETCLKASEAFKLDVNNLAPGFYIIINEDGAKAKLLVK
jgi:spore coat protein CotH